MCHIMLKRKREKKRANADDEKRFVMGGVAVFGVYSRVHSSLACFYNNASSSNNFSIVLSFRLRIRVRVRVILVIILNVIIIPDDFRRVFRFTRL